MDMPDIHTGPPDFDNSYARLPDQFHARIAPTPVKDPKLIRLNIPLACELGLDPDWLASPRGIAMLSGNALPDGAEPIAQAYAGHQFGSWVPQLGDGRAVLLGEVIDRTGARRDIQLKGAGQTPFSRMGDGRAPLGPVLREYIVSEAMAALGVPTTRALAAVATGEPVMREAVLPGGVLTRVASSHIRVGTFQFFAARRDTDGLQSLADHVIQRHYPDATDVSDLLAAVIERQATLVARWMSLGFIHGVMNTDNMTLSGETIDYGPCAFMDDFHPGKVFSSIDVGGRYAFANQPRIAQWNLAQLAQALLPLFPGDQNQQVASAQALIDTFPDRWLTAWRQIMAAKIGIMRPVEGDHALIEELLQCMTDGQADYTLTFRRLPDLLDGGPGPRVLFGDPAPFDAWAKKWRERLAVENPTDKARQDEMRSANPLFIPRNHRVEQAIAAAMAGDYSVFERLTGALTNPFEDCPGNDDLADPPATGEEVNQTFCGT